MVHAAVYVLVVVSVAFLPSLFFLVRMRNWERFDREPYVRLLLVFGYGAGAAIVISVLLEVLIIGNLDRFDRLYQLGDESFLGAVVVAPVVEEMAKALGLLFVMTSFQREEDGMVYGVAAGLGFAATENLLYEVAALAMGVGAFLMTAILRTVSSTLLHATATGLSGLGVGKVKVGNRPMLYAFPFYLGAVAMHSGFNYMAGLSRTHPDAFGNPGTTALISLIVVIVFAGLAWGLTYQRISSR